MKYYETHFEDYISSLQKYNMHPELEPIFERFPRKINQMENIIVYGPSGTGKYSQVLNMIRRYSPSELKYDKKITIQTEKQDYIYRISDIHYEIDMSLLGCNSKLLWHEIFFQIIDIISVKTEKIGVILCKNFHLIHGELLEIFYSYIQQYNNHQSSIRVKFIIITEHISFLPNQIINICQVINVQRPSKDQYLQMSFLTNHVSFNRSINTSKTESFIKRISEFKNNTGGIERVQNIMKEIETNGITNSKEIRSFSLIDTSENIPKDVFNIICDNIIDEIACNKNISFTGFRDTLYDLLTYNLDISESLWYIITYFIKNENFTRDDIDSILAKTHTFFKYYNNNYRPIYHLESIMFTIITKIRKYDDLH